MANTWFVILHSKFSILIVTQLSISYFIFLLQVLHRNTDDINDMRYIMRQAIELDEASIIKEEEIMASLWKENRVNIYYIKP